MDKEIIKSEVKTSQANWHTPTLGVDCPHCGEWNDIYEQVVGHEYIFGALERYERKDCEGVEFKCEDCKEVFELEGISY